MNKGCPKCGSKALKGKRLIKQSSSGRRTVINGYICRCGWIGEWDQLKKRVKNVQKA